MILIDITAPLEGLVALNNQFAAQTSWLDVAALAQMTDIAAYARCDSDGRAFLLAFDQDAGYDSRNFLWFKARLDRFLYIDRIVVAAAAHGQGLGRALYEDLFERAKALGHDRIVCEVNLKPANPGSLAFHARLGFTEAGAADLPQGKRVQYLQKTF